MTAEIIKILSDDDITEALLNKLVKVLNNGGVICFPTETVYALAADASNTDAVNRIYKIKGRDTCKPLSVLVGTIYQAKTITEFNDHADKLIARFCPGPLTLILKSSKNRNISPDVNKNIGTLGIRIPNHKLSLKLLKAFGRPLVGTSANKSDEKSATTAQEVIESLGKKVDIIIDQPIFQIGIPSTIVDLSGDPQIIRVGNLTKEKILHTLKT